MAMILNEIEIIFKIMLCAALMFIIGKERQKKKRFVGPRTLMLIGCATTLLSAISSSLDISFILGGTVTGVGFLGGGVITKENGKVSGLTTASMIWLAAIIGISIGLELYLTSIFVTVFSFFVLRNKNMLRAL